MKEMSCPHCEKVTNVEEIIKNETYTKGNISFTYKAKYYLCKECKNQFNTPEQMTFNLNSMKLAFKLKN